MLKEVATKASVVYFQFRVLGLYCYDDFSVKREARNTISFFLRQGMCIHWPTTVHLFHSILEKKIKRSQNEFLVLVFVALLLPPDHWHISPFKRRGQKWETGIWKFSIQWKQTSRGWLVNQLTFILEYREYIGLENLETNSNVHELAQSYCKASCMAVGFYGKAPSVSLSCYICSRGKNF